MKNPFTILLILCLPASQLLAQDLTTPFEFQPPKPSPQKSFYKSIDFLDARTDKVSIGIVGVGLLKNTDGQLVLKLPVQPQLANILTALLDSTAGDGELVFQLRRFKFVEQYSTRYCFLFATLYAKKADRYQKLMSLDTVIVIGGGDTKKVLIKAASAIVTAFLTEGLRTQPLDTVSYGPAEVEKIDSIEKSRIPLYTAATYVDGVYKSYTSFSNQRPDLQAMVKTNKSGLVTSVKVLDPDGKKRELKRTELYAIVYNGVPFIVTEYGYYPLLRLGADFYFTGDIRVAPSRGDLAGAQFALGLVGTMIARQGSAKTYRLEIDYLNGDFVHIRAIPPPDQGVY